MTLRSRVQEGLSILTGNIRVFAITSVLGMFGRSMAFPFASLYILHLGGNPEQIGIVMALAPLLGLLALPIGGYLVDNVGRVKLIGITGICSGLISLLFYVVAPSWLWLAAGALLLGLSVMQFPASSAIIADSLTPETRGRGIATLSMLSSAPAMLAPLAAGAILEALGDGTGMRVLYGVLAFANFTAGILNLTMLNETTEPSVEHLRWRICPRL